MEGILLWSVAVLAGMICCEGRAGRLLLRTAAGAVVLALLEPLAGIAGFSLGVNPFHALVLGALGAPGLGLLLMLRWTALVV